MSNFTKGPWVVSDGFGENPEGFSVSAADKTMICSCTGYFGRKGANSNAHLIASAPDMYEALERTNLAISHALPLLMNMVGRDSIIVAEMLNVEFPRNSKALAKARGEQ